MLQEIIAANNRPLILTTGIYDLIKEHIRRKKVSPLTEEILRRELKTAMQVPRKYLPSNVVNVDTRVIIKRSSTGTNETYVFVAPEKARKKNNTESVLNPMGLALVGYKEGDVITWSFGNEVEQIEILTVERLT